MRVSPGGFPLPIKFSAVYPAKVRGFSEALVPIAAGGFIYIAGSDLIPELKHNVRIRESALQLMAIVAGLAIMLLLSHTGHEH